MGKVHAHMLQHQSPTERAKNASDQHIFGFMCALAQENVVMQSKLLLHSDLLLSYVGIAGVKVERVLTAAVRNNQDNIKKKSKEWCKFVFEAIMNKYGQFQSEHLDLMTALLACDGKPIKDVQDFVRTQIISNAQLENLLMAHRIQDPFEVTFDPVADAHTIHLESNSLLLLARVCEGKNPASNVFAERFVSLEWLVCSLLNLPASLDSLEVGHRYKRALLTCLNQIHLLADFTSIQHQVTVLEAGFWTLDSDVFADFQHCLPLMLMFKNELACASLSLRLYAQSALAPSATLVSGQEHPAVPEHEETTPSERSKQLRSLKQEYIFYVASILRLIRNYYHLPPFEMPERSRHYRVTQEIRNELESLSAALQSALPVYQRSKRAGSAAPKKIGAAVSAGVDSSAELGCDSGFYECSGDLEKLAEALLAAQRAVAPPTMQRIERTLHKGPLIAQGVGEEGDSDLAFRLSGILAQGFRCMAGDGKMSSRPMLQCFRNACVSCLATTGKGEGLGFQRKKVSCSSSF